MQNKNAPKIDPFTYHVIFDADSVDNDDALPAAREGRYLIANVRTHRNNTYTQIKNQLKNIYGAVNPRPVSLMRLSDGQVLTWNEDGLAVAN